MKKEDEVVSQRELARRTNLSEGMIRLAIRQQKILKGVIYDEKGNPSILYETAKLEMEMNCVGMKKELEQEQEPEPESLSISELEQQLKETEEKIDQTNEGKDAKLYYSLLQIYDQIFMELEAKRNKKKTSNKR